MADTQDTNGKGQVEIDDSALDDEQIIDGYIQLRDQVDAEKKAFEERVKPLKDLMGQLQASMHKRMLERGSDAVKSKKAGTAFFKKVESVSVADWSQTLPFIQKEERWDLLNAAVNKSAVIEYMEKRAEELKEKGETGETLPPGVKYSSFVEVQFRRPSGKA